MALRLVPVSFWRTEACRRLLQAARDVDAATWAKFPFGTSRQSLERRIEASLSVPLRTALADGSSTACCLTCDHWSTPTGQSLFGINAVVVDAAGKRRVLLLALRECASTTGEETRMVIEAAIASAGTRISPVAIVTDGASSMLNAASDAGFGSPGKPAVRCLMHLINNAVALLLGKELMSAVSHAVTRGRRRFPDWAANMRAAGETPPGQPQRMVKTRPLSIAPSVRWVVAVAEAHGRQHLDAEDIARLTEFAPALDALHDIVRHVESDSASYGWHCVLPALLRAHPSTWHRELVNAYNATTTKRITCPTTVISERVTKILRDKLEMELGVGDDRPPTGLCLTAALTDGCDTRCRWLMGRLWLDLPVCWRNRAALFLCAGGAFDADVDSCDWAKHLPPGHRLDTVATRMAECAASAAAGHDPVIPEEWSRAVGTARIILPTSADVERLWSLAGRLYPSTVRMNRRTVVMRIYAYKRAHGATVNPTESVLAAAPVPLPPRGAQKRQRHRSPSSSSEC